MLSLQFEGHSIVKGHLSLAGVYVRSAPNAGRHPLLCRVCFTRLHIEAVHLFISCGHEENKGSLTYVALVRNGRTKAQLPVLEHACVHTRVQGVSDDLLCQVLTTPGVRPLGSGLSPVCPCRAFFQGRLSISKDWQGFQFLSCMPIRAR